MRKAARSELIGEEHEANTFSLFAPLDVQTCSLTSGYSHYEFLVYT